jgi:type IV secretory pathway VirD2 relaxase
LARCASAETDNADGHAFTECGREDRQFRFIIAPEDGDRLSDLRAATRDLMRKMEQRVTLELGPETDLELRTKLQAEVSADRFTRIDRAMLARPTTSSWTCGRRPARPAPTSTRRCASAACRSCSGWGSH